VLPAERSPATCCRGAGAEASPELGTGLASRDLHPTQEQSRFVMEQCTVFTFVTLPLPSCTHLGTADW
jgi:hypothetical protein